MSEGTGARAAPDQQQAASDGVPVGGHTDLVPVETRALMSQGEAAQRIAAWLADPTTSNEDVDAFVVEHGRRKRAQRNKAGQ